MTDAENRRLATLPDDPDQIVACEEVEQPHQWTAWEFGQFFPREERWCLACGVMEWQEIRRD